MWLINDKKKVIVNVDRIKPYQIQEAPHQPAEDTRTPVALRDAPTQYEFDGEKFVPSQHVNEPASEIKAQTPKETVPMPLPDEISDHPDPSPTENRKRGRPKKVEQAKTPQKKNKWSIEAQAPSTSRMMTRSQARQSPEETAATLRTSIPCFCGNQRILKNHSWNCKQQMFNWISTGDPYSWTEGDWAHESDVTEPVYVPNNEEDDFGLPNLFNETGYRGSSDINPTNPKNN
jgi:hypothetical protein